MCVRKCKPLFGQAFLIDEIRIVVGGVEFSGWQPGHQELSMGKSEGFLQQQNQFLVMFLYCVGLSFSSFV